VRRFRERERVDALASLERFRNYWLGKSGRSATKVDWERTFTNWVLEDIARGRAGLLERPSTGEPPQPAPDALAPADASAHLERLQSELAFAGALPWEKAG
jgi:hypothetical protein